MKNATMLNVRNGSMSVWKNPAKVRNIERKRHFLTEKSVGNVSAQVLSDTQSPHPTGTQFTAETLLFKGSDLSANAQAWIQSHDVFKIEEVEVFATLFSKNKGGSFPNKILPVEIYAYEDTDADPATQTSWLRTMDRDNLVRNVLNQWNPTVRIAKFKPTVTLAATGSSGQDAANLIPSKGSWIDALSLDQIFSGLRVFTCCGAQDPSGQSYDYTIRYTMRYKIAAKQPI